MVSWKVTPSRSAALRQRSIRLRKISKKSMTELKWVSTVSSSRATFDIHDRVNYSVKKAALKINEEKTLIKLKLDVDTKYGSVMDYFEIFMGRMILCRKAAEKLGLQFKLIINEQQLI